MAMRSAYYGHWKIGLYSAHTLIGAVDYPVGDAGPVETPETHAFARGWKAGRSAADMQAEFPGVLYHPNTL